MNDEIEFYINENGIACVPLKMYNDSLEKIERLNNIIKEAREYIENHIRIDDEYPDYMEMLLEEYNELLEILDKGDDYNE